MEGPKNLTQSKIVARVVSIIENCKCYSFENMIIKVLIYFDWNSYTYSSQLANVIFCFRQVKSTLAQKVKIHMVILKTGLTFIILSLGGSLTPVFFTRLDSRSLRVR